MLPFAVYKRITNLHPILTNQELAVLSIKKSVSIVSMSVELILEFLN